MITTVDDLPRIAPRSAVRYRPVTSDIAEVSQVAPRASRSLARKEREPHTTGGPPSVIRTHTGQGPLLAAVGISMLVTLLLLAVGQWVWNWGHTTLDDLQYGRPRTFQVDAFVGHEAGKTASHFVALNLHGQVEIMELPGGDPARAKLYIGPQIAASNADLLPVTLSFVENPHTHRLDLLVHCGNTQIRYYNAVDHFEAQK